MRIPENSEVLIEVGNLVSLTFAALLSANGIKVLVIDADEKIDTLYTDDFSIDDDELKFLKEIGYELKDHQIDYSDFIKQTLKLLAKNLCSVIWKTSIKQHHKGKIEFELEKDEQIHHHKTSFHFKKEDIIISDKLNINLTNIFLMGWRIIGVIKRTLNQTILDTRFSESDLIKNQLEKVNKPSHLLNRIARKKIKAFPNLIDSKLSLHLSQERKVEAGELLPDLKIYDEKQKLETSLHHWCAYHQFSLILFGNLIPTNLFAIARWIQLNYPIQFYYLPQTEKNESVFEYFKIRKGERKTMIIRPDLFIGLIHDAIDIDIIDNYLSNFIKMKAKETPQANKNAI
ncbi:MAG: hypothetical protein KKE39_07670 [Bacteroidetes bacterium]|nr:hypothetical protein [Bacteroidota bacterium]MBU1374201.1 hypothetical protein [Bacteroidota bacterium]MBU1485913.1 hypothetical protein [Bacteroidota bacterium]MBU1760034.1 hypothetical protein [Bacteroidota bacterium]MBU2046581.1 hypothetical protein [Bacteroidota bacterium]